MEGKVGRIERVEMESMKIRLLKKRNKQYVNKERQKEIKNDIKR